MGDEDWLGVAWQAGLGKTRSSVAGQGRAGGARLETVRFGGAGAVWHVKD